MPNTTTNNNRTKINIKVNKMNKNVDNNGVSMKMSTKSEHLPKIEHLPNIENESKFNFTFNNQKLNELMNERYEMSREIEIEREKERLENERIKIEKEPILYVNCYHVNSEQTPMNFLVTPNKVFRTKSKSGDRDEKIDWKGTFSKKENEFKQSKSIVIKKF